MAERPSLSSRTSVPAWTELNNLTSSSLGGEVLFSTDDWFAAAEMLLSDEEPQWREGFTEQVNILYSQDDDDDDDDNDDDDDDDDEREEGEEEAFDLFRVPPSIHH